ncbi:hypothetical protein [Isoalcanivorax indicus]|uniref:hypothetical protein n=1 Tax=Isoalcanivorax indicus TaxID=2202653 RepID=UPI000DB9784E|nr:hypothetical protein [Isoalcanivorax indicus]
MKAVTAGGLLLGIAGAALAIIVGIILGENEYVTPFLFSCGLLFVFLLVFKASAKSNGGARILYDTVYTVLYILSASFSILIISLEVVSFFSLLLLVCFLGSHGSQSRRYGIFISLWLIFAFIFNLYMLTIVDLETHNETGFSPMMSYEQIRNSFACCFIMWGLLQPLLYLYRKHGGEQWSGIIINIFLLYPAYYASISLLPGK